MALAYPPEYRRYIWSIKVVHLVEVRYHQMDLHREVQACDNMIRFSLHQKTFGIYYKIFRSIAKFHRFRIPIEKTRVCKFYI